MPFVQDKQKIHKIDPDVTADTLYYSTDSYLSVIS